MKHQRQQSVDLRLLGHLIAQYSREPDRLFGKTDSAAVRACGILPAAAVRGVDRIEHRFQALRDLVRCRDLERDLRLANLVLRAHQSLAHRLRRNEKRARDCDCIQTEHRLQHQRRVHVVIDGRMRADEQQFQALVGESVGVRSLVEVAHHQLQSRNAVIANLSVSRLVEQAIARRRHQPALRILRHAVARPRRQRRHQRIGERILRSGNVARASRQQRDEPAVGLARDGFDGALRQFICCFIGLGIHPSHACALRVRSVALPRRRTKPPGSARPTPMRHRATAARGS